MVASVPPELWTNSLLMNRPRGWDQDLPFGAVRSVEQASGFVLRHDAIEVAKARRWGDGDCAARTAAGRRRRMRLGAWVIPGKVDEARRRAKSEATERVKVDMVRESERA